MVDHREQIEALLAEAFGTKDPVREIALLEEAIRIADSHQDQEAGYALRKSLIHSATFGGMPEKVVPAYTWCLALCDRQPEQFQEDDLLWHSKWVLDVLPEFPGVSLAQIGLTLDEMTNRYQRVGASLRSVHKLRCAASMDFGDSVSAAHWFQLWQGCQRDRTSDCEACDLDTVVQYYVFQEKDAEALAAAQPILRGQMRCAEVPHITYGRLLEPLTRLGQLDKAMELHRRGYPLIARNREMLVTASRHLEFLVQTDNLPKAVTLFQKWLDWALECKAGLRQFEFFISSLFLWERLKTTSKPTRKLRLPSHFALYNPENVYNVAVMAQWIEQQAHCLAQAIDQRNGNLACANRLDEIPARLGAITPFPLSSNL